MPKVIKDLKEKILSSALELFESIGYDNVNMRKIAKETGIAVGTLYNHYPNKEELFLCALEASWHGTVTTLNHQMSLINSTDEKISVFVSTLYDSICNRKGLGKELLFKGMKNKNGNGSIKTIHTFFDSIKEQLTTLLENHYKTNNINTIYLSRKIDAAVNIIAQFTEKYPNERELNINYIISLLTEGPHE